MQQLTDRAHLRCEGPLAFTEAVRAEVALVDGDDQGVL
jgi:hypothetical protein